MANDYKTPGVYIEEIPKFPPSVAQVETAIPAFIGYTAKARRDGEDRVGRPTRITSLLEYQEYFGGPESETAILVSVERESSGGKITKEIWTASLPDATASKHIMYYALQSYFDNGGGPCYIVSVGGYLGTVGADIPQAALLAGLNALKEEDEPTLIVFPEGQGMNEGEYFSILNSALTQCNDLKDRFVVMDLHTPQRQ